MRYCNKCETEKPLTGFSKNKSTKSGYNSTCKECTKVLTRRHYERNRPDYKVRQENRRRKNLERCNEIKSTTGCENCGDTRFYVLDFHHTNPDEKSFGIANSLNFSWGKLEKEITKCKVQCSNCHREEHHLSRLI